MCDEARREYACAAETHVPEVVTQHGPPRGGEPPLTLEQSEELDPGSSYGPRCS